MKNIFLILIFLPFLGFSQKIYFSDTANKWIVGDTVPGKLNFYNYYYEGTRLLTYNSKTLVYNILKTDELLNPCPCYIREDSNKVYIVITDHSNNQPDTIERVLYDYNLTQYDSTYTKEWDIYHEPYFYKVFNLDSTKVDGIWHKVWYIKSIPWIAPDLSYYIIQGIGSTKGPIYPILAQWSYERVICFNQSTHTPSIIPGVNYGTGYTSTSIFNNSTCLLENYSYRINKELNIYPNPVQDKLMIENLDEKYIIEIYNILGNKVYIGKETIINTSNWVPGVYYIKIGNISKKIIKE